MKYLVNLTPETLGRIKEIVQSGAFQSVDQFIEVAIENQVSFENSGPGLLDSAKPKDMKDIRLEPKAHDSDMLRLSSIVPLFVQGDSAIRDGLIWSLYNRFFPVKISVRVLARMAQLSGKAESPLVDLREQASQEAYRVGRALWQLDKRVERANRQKLSTALPIKGKEKAISRFQEMFVGGADRNGQAYGLGNNLGFITIVQKSRGKGSVALTQSGWDFARLPNPILDSMPILNDPDSTLSVSERGFLLNRIQKVLPDEHRAIMSLLRDISKGKSTPIDLQSTLAKTSNIKIDKARIASAGVISRMVELGLVTRTRIGLAVTYALTPQGNQVLQELSLLR